MNDEDSPDTRSEQPARPDREVRFEMAGRALAAARLRNLPEADGGSGCAVLVEGINDEKALRALGFLGPVECVNRGWDRGRLVAYLYETYGTTNSVDGEAVMILLMDWDRTGGRLQRELGRRLEAFDMRIDHATRMALVRALKPEGRTVEMLGAHAEALLAAMRPHDPPRG